MGGLGYLWPQMHCLLFSEIVLFTPSWATPPIAAASEATRWDIIRFSATVSPTTKKGYHPDGWYPIHTDKIRLRCKQLAISDFDYISLRLLVVRREEWPQFLHPQFF